jgi:hypothetical protein
MKNALVARGTAEEEQVAVGVLDFKAAQAILGVVGDGRKNSTFIAASRLTMPKKRSSSLGP